MTLFESLARVPIIVSKYRLARVNGILKGTTWNDLIFRMVLLLLYIQLYELSHGLELFVGKK